MIQELKRLLNIIRSEVNPTPEALQALQEIDDILEKLTKE
jgi:hypothetical protein